MKIIIPIVNVEADGDGEADGEADVDWLVPPVLDALLVAFPIVDPSGFVTVKLFSQYKFTLVLSNFAFSKLLMQAAIFKLHTEEDAPGKTISLLSPC